MIVGFGPGPGTGLYRTRRAATSYPLLDDLIGYWNLDEASGQRNDSHTNALHLLDNNTVGVSSGGGPDSGDAADFEADSGENLSRTSESLLQTGNVDFAVAAWVWLESKGAEARTLLAKRDSGSGEFTIVHETVSDRFWFYNVDEIDSVKATSFGSPALNTWYFLVAWQDTTAGTWNISVNDGAVDSAIISAPVVDSSTFRIGGQYPGTSWWMDGRIAYVGFWKRTLTAAERTWLYNSGSGRDYAAVAAYTG